MQRARENPAEELLAVTRGSLPKVKPYGYTLSCLANVRQLQCPNLKLHHVFSCLKTSLASEIESYYSLVAKAVSDWAQRYRAQLQSDGESEKMELLRRLVDKNLSPHGPNMNVSIDIDTLQTLCIYLVLQLDYAHFIADYQMIHDFVSENVKLSARFIYLNVLKGGTDYLLEMAW